jgi:hypothetical protein
LKRIIGEKQDENAPVHHLKLVTDTFKRCGGFLLLELRRSYVSQRILENLGSIDRLREKAQKTSNLISKINSEFF